MSLKFTKIIKAKIEIFASGYDGIKGSNIPSLAFLNS